ncbi:MAG: hypothetical protein ABIO92_01080 [Chloroflexia bacterium]
MSQTHERPDRGSTPGTPRWVKVFGIVALILVLLLVVIMLIGGGEHGPGRHMPSGDPGGGYTLPIEHRIQQS